MLLEISHFSCGREGKAREMMRRKRERWCWMESEGRKGGGWNDEAFLYFWISSNLYGNKTYYLCSGLVWSTLVHSTLLCTILSRKSSYIALTVALIFSFLSLFSYVLLLYSFIYLHSFSIYIHTYISIKTPSYPVLSYPVLPLFLFTPFPFIENTLDEYLALIKRRRVMWYVGRRRLEAEEWRMG